MLSCLTFCLDYVIVLRNPLVEHWFPIIRSNIHTIFSSPFALFIFIYLIWEFTMFYVWYIDFKTWCLVTCLYTSISTGCLNNIVSFVVLQVVDQYPDTKVVIILLVYAYAENHAFGFWLGHKWNEYYVACQVGHAIDWNCSDCYQQHSHKGWCMWSSFPSLIPSIIFYLSKCFCLTWYGLSLIYSKGAKLSIAQFGIKYVPSTSQNFPLPLSLELKIYSKWILDHANYYVIICYVLRNFK